MNGFKERLLVSVIHYPHTVIGQISGKNEPGGDYGIRPLTPPLSIEGHGEGSVDIFMTALRVLNLFNF